MLHVKTSEAIFSLLEERFSGLAGRESLGLDRALGRVLAEDITASEYVPDFDRSTVDGYAVRAADTFGCSDSMPAMLRIKGEILMGESAGCAVGADECAAIPTGGALPEGADACVMVEYTETYGDGTVGILKPAVPGANLIFRGDDVKPGKIILRAGRTLGAGEIGALAALGIAEVSVVKKIRAGVISTGDELVPVHVSPGPGQVRDVNSAVVCALMEEAGALVTSYGIVRDDKESLGRILDQALEENDVVLMSGGSSVGLRDMARDLISERGEVLFHGIAIKPGKPTLMGCAGDKVILGLPGHPAAAFFITRLFGLRLLDVMQGRRVRDHSQSALLGESLASNHGREEFVPVRLEVREGETYAVPVRTKSGLITTLAATDGYIRIPRDAEGLEAGSRVAVMLF